jgi:hypothetical protein
MREKLGHGLDVPIGEPDTDVTEVGCQCRQSTRNVDVRLVPLDEPTGGERVPHILQPRAAAPPAPLERRPQPDRARDHGKHSARRVAAEAAAVLREQERGTLGPGAERGASRPVLA